ncbi:flagellar basal-body rod protein FlgF [Marivibrio halodurans]|nr:flagellar basal-body rod protein FlgF [Marivibrio halodurans]
MEKGGTIAAMENALYIGLSRQTALRREMDVIANNIANANTPAFKAEKMIFQEFLSKPGDRERISLVQDFGQARDLSEGPAEPTGNPLDVAIHGDGYFTVDTPLGERYTRHGRFQLDATGQLVTSAGHAVQGQAGPINIPTDGGPISIAADGTVSNDNGVLGVLQLVTFDDQQALKRAANGLYSAEDQNPQPVDNPTMSQGMIEGSNVESIVEMTRMMTVSRKYQSLGRFLEKEDERLTQMITTLGKRPS